MADEIEILKTDAEWCSEHNRYKILDACNTPYCPLCKAKEISIEHQLLTAQQVFEEKVIAATDDLLATIKTIITDVRRPN